MFTQVWPKKNLPDRLCFKLLDAPKVPKNFWPKKWAGLKTPRGWKFYEKALYGNSLGWSFNLVCWGSSSSKKTSTPMEAFITINFSKKTALGLTIPNGLLPAVSSWPGHSHCNIVSVGNTSPNQLTGFILAILAVFPSLFNSPLVVDKCVIKKKKKGKHITK